MRVRTHAVREGEKFQELDRLHRREGGKGVKRVRASPAAMFYRTREKKRVYIAVAGNERDIALPSMSQ